MCSVIRRTIQVIVFSVLLWPVLLGQTASTQESQPAFAADPLGRSTPRGTMFHFLRVAQDGNFATAAQYLKIGSGPGTPQSAAARRLAGQLKAVLDRELEILPGAISDSPEGNLADGFAAEREQVGIIAADSGNVPILLQRIRQADGGQIWLFASETLEKIPEVYQSLAPSIIERHLPRVLVTTQLFGLAAWRWIALLLLIPTAVGLAWLISLVFFRAVSVVVRRTSWQLDDDIASMIRGPLRLLLTVWVFHSGMSVLDLPFLARQAIGTLELVLAATAVSWFVLRLIDFGADRAKLALIRKHRISATAVVPLGRRIVKVMVLSIVVMAALDNAGFEMKTVLAGLGVGGIAVALAAQKTIENLFGGISLVVDQPVRVGDFCKYGDSVGTVEDVGLRSTRVRTLDRTVVTIPNAQFASLNVENFAPRDKVWFHPMLALRLDTTPDQLRYVLAEIRRLLYEHASVEPGGRVRLVSFGAYSLNLEIFAYVTTADSDAFLPIQEDLLLQILEIIAAAGTGLAIPAQIDYMSSDRGLDPEQATEMVKRWRQEGKLPFPDYSPEEISAMRNRIAYPPPESVLRNGSR
jgi:MscS family membrane protein